MSDAVSATGSVRFANERLKKNLEFELKIRLSSITRVKVFYTQCLFTVYHIFLKYPISYNIPALGRTRKDKVF